MKNFKIKFISLILTLSIIFSLGSCMTTKTQVGAFQETQGKEYTYAKGKQMWLFWGIVPVGRTSVNTPSDGHCEIVTRYTISDILITGFTGGLLKTYSIKVVAKKPIESKE